MRHYATSRKVTGSIPSEVNELVSLNFPNPSSRTKALGFTQSLHKLVPGIFMACKLLPALKADVIAICETIV
jgi:hypothetical protein